MSGNKKFTSLCSCLTCNVWQKCLYYHFAISIFFLAKAGIHTVGTVQLNRIPNKKLPEKKDFVKKSVPRAWKDNKVVTLLSTYAEALPVTKVDRSDKLKEEKIDITCPFIIQEYNKHMGGVDLVDSFLGRNHITMRSKKWYLRIFFHLFDPSLINSWIIYKKNAQERGESKKSLLTMSQSPLTYATREPLKMLKGGVPAAASLKKRVLTKKRKGSPAPPPTKDVRKDGLEHWPTVTGSLRCKYPKCKGYFTISCGKCKVNLCLNKIIIAF